MKDFNPSNEPRTCLYCGKALKPMMESATRPAGPEEIAQYRARFPDDRGFGAVRIEPSRDDSWVKRNRETGDFTVTYQRESGRFGPYGDDFFCTLRCAADFGRLAADKGVRYTKQPEA